VSGKGFVFRTGAHTGWIASAEHRGWAMGGFGAGQRGAPKRRYLIHSSARECVGLIAGCGKTGLAEQFCSSGVRCSGA
jgi:hypothetical protein